MQEFNSKRPQRVIHGVGDGRWRRDGAAFPDALDANMV